jgi:serine/threonine protein phosphatase 1
MRGTLNDRTARQLVESYVPSEHIEFLSGLPLTIQTPRALFVHAGLRPGVPLGEQSESDLMGYRDDFAASFAEFGTTVVHGHVIRGEPLVTPGRIAIDTGAYLNGRLSAVRLMPNSEPKILSAASAGSTAPRAVLN